MGQLKDNIASIQSLVDAGIMGRDEFEAQREQYFTESYQEAEALLAKGDKGSLQKAKASFAELGNYKDALSKQKACLEKIEKLDLAQRIANKKRNKLIGIVAAVIVVAAIGVGIGISAHNKAEQQKFEQTMIAQFGKVPTVGDTITFGTYQQSTSGGPAAITWRVLAIEGGKMLVISEYGLDCRQFNSSRSKGNAWDSSDLKSWLNGTFKSAAFSSDELQMVGEVICLSVDEADQYFSGHKDRVCYPTAHAKAQGVWTSSSGACGWWLRSPGSDGSECAAFVDDGGYVDTCGSLVDGNNYAVRPALWL